MMKMKTMTSKLNPEELRIELGLYPQLQELEARTLLKSIRMVRLFHWQAIKGGRDST
jgi:hypothetical protein